MQTEFVVYITLLRCEISLRQKLAREVVVSAERRDIAWYRFTLMCRRLFLDVLGSLSLHL